MGSPFESIAEDAMSGDDVYQSEELRDLFTLKFLSNYSATQDSS